MRKFLGKLGAFPGSLLHAATLLLLISPTICHAQGQFVNCDSVTDPQFYYNGFSFTGTQPASNTWVPGQTYTVTAGGWGVSPAGCLYEVIRVYNSAGQIDPYVTTSPVFEAPGQLIPYANYVDATHTSFTLTVASGAPDETDIIQLVCEVCFLSASEYKVQISIQTPLPPPPPPPPCGTITIDSVTPSTWTMGKTYQVTITGTDFVAPSTSDDPTYCQQNVTRLWVEQGGNYYSPDFTVVSPTQINATIKMDASTSLTAGSATLWAENCDDGCVTETSVPVQIVSVPTITLERIDLMDVKATGTPNVTGTSDTSAFKYLSVSASGSTVAKIGYASGSNAQSNPTFFQLTEPDNSCKGGKPCQGGLKTITASYTVDGVSSADKSFNVPTFGMSCYNTTAESDWGSPPNNCSVFRWKGTVYSGTVTNPGSLTGTYCEAFIADVIRNAGSGVLNNGIAVQKVNGNISQTPDGKIYTADGTVPIPFQTVARNRSIIPGKGVLIDLDQVGTGIHADDIGGDIVGYRLDLYKGVGKPVCAHNDNVMAVGACTPATSGCPASAIQ
jgi:3D (Asp-Asp-Asp) domain-containing protein